MRFISRPSPPLSGDLCPHTGEFTIHPPTVAKVSRGSIDNSRRFMSVVNNKKKKKEEGKKIEKKNKRGMSEERERKRERGKKKGIEKYP